MISDRSADKAAEKRTRCVGRRLLMLAKVVKLFEVEGRGDGVIRAGGRLWEIAGNSGLHFIVYSSPRDYRSQMAAHSTPIDSHVANTMTSLLF